MFSVHLITDCRNWAAAAARRTHFVPVVTAVFIRHCRFSARKAINLNKLFDCVADEPTLLFE